MSSCVRAARALLLGLFVVGAVSGCSLPLLESQGEGGPRVKDIVKHINCEFAELVWLSKVNPAEIVRNPIPPDTSTSFGRLVARIRAEPQSLSKYQKLLRRLTDDHFVASVTMILDVLNSQGLNPSLSFISPINNSSMFNQTFSVGGSLNGSQERNISQSYFIDLDHVAAECKNPERAVTGLTGDLGLADIVVDGLSGLDVSKKVNIYGSAGPAPLPMTYELQDWFMTLQFGSDAPTPGDLKMNFKGSISFSPSATDPRSPGALSLTGVVIPEAQLDPKKGELQIEKDLQGKTITDKKGNPVYGRKNGYPINDNSYFINLSGSTFQRSEQYIDFSLTGTMTQSTLTDDKNLQSLGFSPKLTLAGTINNNIDVFYSPIRMTSGSISSDANAAANVLSPPLTPGKPNPLSIPVQLCQFEQAPRQLPPEFRTGECRFPNPPKKGVVQPLAAGLTGAGGQSSSKVAGTASSASSTQFSSLVNFVVSYGVNGGPNWTLATFKGPGGGGGGGGSSGGGGGGGSSGGGGGGGGGGQLASINRTDTDTLTITFVAACKDDPNSPKPTDYWDALPRCNQNSTINAANVGAETNRNFLLLQRVVPGL